MTDACAVSQCCTFSGASLEEWLRITVQLGGEKRGVSAPPSAKFLSFSDRDGNSPNPSFLGS